MSSLRGETHPGGTIGADLKGVLHCPLVCLLTIHAALFDEVEEGMGQCGETVVLDHGLKGVKVDEMGIRTAAHHDGA